MRNYLVVCLLSHCFSKHIRRTNFIYVRLPSKIDWDIHSSTCKICGMLQQNEYINGNDDRGSSSGGSSLIQFSKIFRIHAANIYEMKNERTQRWRQRERERAKHNIYLSESIAGFAVWHTNYRIINVVASIFLLVLLPMYTFRYIRMCIRYDLDGLTLMSCACACVYVSILHCVWVAATIFGTIAFDYSSIFYRVFLATATASAAAAVDIVAILNHNSNCYFMWFDGVQAIRHRFCSEFSKFREEQCFDIKTTTTTAAAQTYI